MSKRRSGLAHDRRAYRCSYCPENIPKVTPITPIVPTTYTVTYDGNGSTGGSVPAAPTTYNA